jgi:hypothetical protein
MENDSMNTLNPPNLHTLATLAISAVPALVALPSHAAADPTSGAAQPLIESFAAAADRRDVAALESILHPEFRVLFAVKAGAAPTQLTRAQYLQLLRDGKLGGKSRVVTVSSVTGVEGFAAATTTMQHDAARFQGVYSLIQHDNRWWLLQETVLMTPTPTPANDATSTR